MKSTINSRNTSGYHLNDNDIEIIQRCLRKKHQRQISNRTFITHCMQKSFPGQSDVLTPLGTGLESTLMGYNTELLQEYPKKIVVPYNIGNDHWTVLEIVLENPRKSFCAAYDTDGKAYPVDQEDMNIIQQAIGGNQTITTLNSPKKIYSFSGQQEVNCGIICAMIAHDLSRDTQSYCNKKEQRNTYADSITAKHKAHNIRDITSTLVNQYGSDADKQNFCHEKRSNFDAARYLRKGGFKPNWDDPSINMMYQALSDLDDETLQALYTAITKHADNGAKQCQEAKKIKNKVPFIIRKDDQGNEIKNDDGSITFVENWQDMTKWFYHEKHNIPHEMPEQCEAEPMPEIVMIGILAALLTTIVPVQWVMVLACVLTGVVGSVYLYENHMGDATTTTTDEVKNNHLKATSIKIPEKTAMNEKPRENERTSDNNWKMATLAAGISTAAALTAYQLGCFRSYSPV